MGRLSHALAGGVHRLGTALVRLLPRGVVKNVEDRVFYVIFQRSRVENDAYGWRPTSPGGPASYRVRPDSDRSESSSGR
jgi:hypothetical protein